MVLLVTLFTSDTCPAGSLLNFCGFAFVGLLAELTVLETGLESGLGVELYTEPVTLVFTELADLGLLEPVRACEAFLNASRFDRVEFSIWPGVPGASVFNAVGLLPFCNAVGLILLSDACGRICWTIFNNVAFRS